LSKTSTASQLLCGFRPVDCARLLVAIAELYSDSSSAGRPLMHELGPSLFAKFPPAKHNVPDLTRMIWALGVLARPGSGVERTLPVLHAALQRCEENMHVMDPKFTMLGAKGLALLARGGLVMHGMHGAQSGAELWPALTQPPLNADEAKVEDEQPQSPSQERLKQAEDLSKVSRAYMHNALTNLARPGRQGAPLLSLPLARNTKHTRTHACHA
jgi:hypothetical protein